MESKLIIPKYCSDTYSSDIVAIFHLGTGPPSRPLPLVCICIEFPWEETVTCQKQANDEHEVGWLYTPTYIGETSMDQHDIAHSNGTEPYNRKTDYSFNLLKNTSIQ